MAGIACLTVTLNAQIGAKKEHDARVERLLEAIDLKYEIDSDGDFQLGNRFDNGRTQRLFVNSNTERYQNMEIREVWSVAYISEDAVSSTIMRNLLKDNGTKKLGSWKLITNNGKEVAVFYAQIAADADRTAFLSALQIVSQAADEMEKQLTGKDDL
jgi:hypothetical protein